MNNTPNNLYQEIIKTVAYFDIFDYPLTAVEVHKWLYSPVEKFSLLQVMVALEQVAGVEEKFGFYFISGHASNITVRLDRYSIAEKKFRIALRFARWIRHLAFVKMIAVCNNVGYNNGTTKSDIDYFIVVDRGRIWWSRLAITLIATALRLRRHGSRFIDRICLSFYISEDHLNLSDISLKPYDPYLAYWFATLAPIFDDGIYQKFMAENSWLKTYLPNLHPTVLSDRRSVGLNFLIKFSRTIDEAFLRTFLGTVLEEVAKAIQIKKVSSYLGESLVEHNTNVVISSSMLKFHKLDRRQMYRLAWEKTLSQLYYA